MTSPAASVLTINGGSSSIRFAVYQVGDTARRQVDGTIDRITDHRAAVGELVDRLEAEAVWPAVRAIGHRVVHGMKHTQPERITPKLLAALRRVTPYDPDHLPRELALIEAFRRRHP
jgi:acetate kinase